MRFVISLLGGILLVTASAFAQDNLATPPDGQHEGGWRVGIRHAPITSSRGVKTRLMGSTDIGQNFEATASIGKVRNTEKNGERITSDFEATTATVESGWNATSYIIPGVGLYWQQAKGQVYENYGGSRIASLYAGQTSIFGLILKAATDWSLGNAHLRMDWIELEIPILIKGKLVAKNASVEVAAPDADKAIDSLSNGFIGASSLLGVCLTYAF